MKKSLLLALVVTCAGSIFSTVQTAWAQSSPATFNFTGGVQNFTVPQCVVEIRIEALGAQGATVVGIGGLGGSAD